MCQVQLLTSDLLPGAYAAGRNGNSVSLALLWGLVALDSSDAAPDRSGQASLRPC